MTQQGWTWAAACRRGVSHERANLRLQDAFKCCIAPTGGKPTIGIVVSDGAGSAAYGGEGASLLCRSLSVRMRRHLADSDALPTDDLLQGWLNDARALILAAAAKRDLEPRDFAATLILLISNGSESVVLHIGDGCAVLREEETRAWVAPSWPYHGEYASTTVFVTDEPPPSTSVIRHASPISAISVFSDGLERLALDLRARQPFAPFFECVIAPVTDSAFFGKDVELSDKLDSFLGGDAINSRSDDDKTLILAVRR